MSFQVQGLASYRYCIPGLTWGGKPLRGLTIAQQSCSPHPHGAGSGSAALSTCSQLEGMIPDSAWTIGNFVMSVDAKQAFVTQVGPQAFLLQAGAQQEIALDPDSEPSWGEPSG